MSVIAGADVTQEKEQAPFMLNSGAQPGQDRGVLTGSPQLSRIRRRLKGVC